MTEAFGKGDVFWAPDPFKSSSNPRLWLVLAADQLPYPGEEYLCAALTTSDLPENVEVGDAWVAGRHPEKRSYCSPWVLGTIKHRAVANPQGALSTAFTNRMVEQAATYLAS